MDVWPLYMYKLTIQPIAYNHQNAMMPWPKHAPYLDVFAMAIPSDSMDWFHRVVDLGVSCQLPSNLEQDTFEPL